ncbi:MAG TPA: biopolymer transporter ExbD [Polyangia bacterium]|jgi:biopolymer transport protein ExbD
MAGGTSSYSDDDAGGAIVDINVTPLVDIVLVLLIIFMVTATYIVNPAIRAELPKAASGEEVKTTLALTLTRGGTLYVNGEAKTEPEAREVVRAAVQANPNIQAIIAADRNVPHGDWVHVVDLAKLSGVRRFAIGTEK